MKRAIKTKAVSADAPDKAQQQSTAPQPVSHLPKYMRFMDAAVDPVRVLLAGGPKTGKTRFAASFPNPVFIDTDRGMKSIAKPRPPAFVISRREPTSGPDELTSYRDVRDIISNLIYKDGPYWDALQSIGYEPKTLVLDSLSSLSDICEVEIIADPAVLGSKTEAKTHGEALQLADYNIIQRRIFGILDLARQLPINFVVTTGVTFTQDDKGILREQPNLTGNKLGPSVPHFFDDVFYMYQEREGNEILYYADNRPTRTWAHSGTRFGVPKDAFKFPTYDDFKPYYEAGNE